MVVIWTPIVLMVVGGNPRVWPWTPVESRWSWWWRHVAIFRVESQRAFRPAYRTSLVTSHETSLCVSHHGLLVMKYSNNPLRTNLSCTYLAIFTNCWTHRNRSDFYKHESFSRHFHGLGTSAWLCRLSVDSLILSALGLPTRPTAKPKTGMEKKIRSEVLENFTGVWMCFSLNSDEAIFAFMFFKLFMVMPVQSLVREDISQAGRTLWSGMTLYFWCVKLPWCVKSHGENRHQWWFIQTGNATLFHGFPAWRTM